MALFGVAFAWPYRDCVLAAAETAEPGPSQEGRQDGAVADLGVRKSREAKASSVMTRFTGAPWPAMVAAARVRKAVQVGPFSSAGLQRKPSGNGHRQRRGHL